MTMQNNLLIVVISLTGATARRNSAQDQLKQSNLDWQFLDAVDGRLFETPPEEYNEKKVKKLLGFSLSPSEIGCFLSHKKAWQLCCERNQSLLILEDDFQIPTSFDNVVNDILSTPVNWDIIRLQGISKTDHEFIHKINETHSLVRNNHDPLGTTGYIIKPKAAANLLKHSRNIFEPVDHFLEHTKYHQANIFAIKPYPIKSSEEPTTIEDRPDRLPIRGIKKIKRSFYRMLDRVFSKKPWF